MYILIKIIHMPSGMSTRAGLEIPVLMEVFIYGTRHVTKASLVGGLGHPSEKYERQLG